MCTTCAKHNPGKKKGEPEKEKTGEKGKKK